MIVQDLLSLSKLEQEEERGEIHLEESHIRPVMESVIKGCADHARQKEIEFRLHCPEDLVAKINPTLLEQAIFNLVDNSIKYSEPGKKVDLEAEKRDHEVVIRVADQGCGIEHLERIFDASIASTRPAVAGHGLGLSIVKHIVRRIGRIQLDSPGHREHLFYSLAAGRELTMALRIRFLNEIERLKKEAVELGTLVEDRFLMAATAIETKNEGLANKVIDGDIEIDQLEVDLEEECLKILALHQPVADNLRFIVAVLKLNNDLERIGDLASNIAEHTAFIAAKTEIRVPYDYSVMFRKVQNMLKKSLDALVNMDVDLAFQVCSLDDEVDYLKRTMQARFIQKVRSNPEEIDGWLHLFLTSRNLERIADHTTNIAEDVIYMISGRIHRQRREFSEGVEVPTPSTGTSNFRDEPGPKNHFMISWPAKT
jgi:phosphate transport system protein